MVIPLVNIVIGVIVAGVALWVLTELPLDAGLKRTARIVIILIFVVWLGAVLTGHWTVRIR